MQDAVQSHSFTDYCCTACKSLDQLVLIWALTQAAQGHSTRLLSAIQPAVMLQHTQLMPAEHGRMA